MIETGSLLSAAGQRFSFDAHATIQVCHVGAEKEPVVIVDGATGHAAALVDFARHRSCFEPAAILGSFYPGLLGTAPTAYVDAMVRFVVPLIVRHFDTGPIRPARARGTFSLVTTPPEALGPDQRVPHVDAADRLQFATVHFLSRDNKDGTGFFRHRATGFETLDTERLPAYRAILDAQLEALQDRGYPGAGHSLFEQIGAVEARFDRLILYRASLFHSGLISVLPEHAADPVQGRLTGNLFLQCRKAA
jgi:hypothetical protein